MNTDKQDTQGSEKKLIPISQQILTSFDPLKKIDIDMQVRVLIGENPDLLPILNFYEHCYLVGNFLGGKCMIQRGEIQNLKSEIEALKATIAEKDKEIEKLFHAEPRK